MSINLFFVKYKIVKKFIYIVHAVTKENYFFIVQQKYLNNKINKNSLKIITKNWLKIKHLFAI